MDVIPTNIAQIDNQLLLSYDGTPLGGLPSDRLVVLRGTSGAGLTTFCTTLLSSPLPLSVIWLDGDFALAEGMEVQQDVVILTPPLEGRIAWAETVIEKTGPLVDIVILDSLDGVVEEDSSRLEELIRTAARVAAGGRTLVLFTAHDFYSLGTNRMTCVGEGILRRYSSLGLWLPQQGVCEVLWSRICRIGKRVRY